MLRYSTAVQNVLLHFHSLIFAFLQADNCLIFREEFSQCSPQLHQWLLIVSNNQYKLEVVWVCYYQRDILKYILE